jgi:helicase
MSYTHPQSSQVGGEPDPATCVIESGFNAVLLMPTGSGKTHRAGESIRRTCQRGRKAIYVTPTRALANELHCRWSGLWPDLKVGIFTGDFGTDRDYPVSYLEADVLIMTPERLDLCTRQWRYHWQWLPQVDVLVVDEIHLLDHPNRGARLEGAIVRMRALNPFARIIGLSATLGNAHELADWLEGVCHQSTWRPIKSIWRTVVFSKADQKPAKVVEAIQPVIAGGGKSLVFVQSKRRAEQLAAYLRSIGIDAGHHHGGLGFDERREVEERFRARSLEVLVATGTLEVGLNLPVRQVVLYDLQQFDGEEFSPLSVISVWQRAGRAGRPGLDDTGEVVMLRARWERDRQYERAQFEPIQSKMACSHNLAEQVIVSIAAGFARDRNELSDLMSSTLAAKQNLLTTLDEQVSKMCSAGFVIEEDFDDQGKRRLRPTALGRLCTRLLISPQTVLRMKRLLLREGAWTFLDLLLVCCAMPDCDPVVTVDFEDLSDLGDRLSRRRSHLLCIDNEGVAQQLEVSPKRLLSSVKGALIMLAWAEAGDAEVVADQLSCYPNEVTRLRESTLRLLSGLRGLLKETRSDDSHSGRDSSYLDKKIARLELMIVAGLDEDAATLTLVPGIGKTWARRLVQNDILDIEMLAQAEVDQLLSMGSLSARRAEVWIAKASELLSSDDLLDATDSGATVRVQATQIELPVDVYRLKRSWQLRVDAAEEPETFRVTGGSDPHVVRGMSGAWTCDCADRAKGHECKHLIAVRRWKGDAVIQSVDNALLHVAPGTEINLQSWWSR